MMKRYRCTSCQRECVTKIDPPPALIRCKCCQGEMLRLKEKPKDG